VTFEAHDQATFFGHFARIVDVEYLQGTSIIFEPTKNLIVGMPILPRTKGGGCPPATTNFEFIEVPSRKNKLSEWNNESAVISTI
jgi:hypothetical protein